MKYKTNSVSVDDGSLSSSNLLQFGLRLFRRFEAP